VAKQPGHAFPASFGFSASAGAKPPQIAATLKPPMKVGLTDPQRSQGAKKAAMTRKARGED
tara:strand:+ start:861 stop:1043 length:183 start_codon:yes stop_codon:yes gene_type:complete